MRARNTEKWKHEFGMYDLQKLLANLSFLESWHEDVSAGLSRLPSVHADDDPEISTVVNLIRFYLKVC